MQTDLVLEDGEEILALLTLPKATERVGAALLLHGFSSRTEQMVNSVGRALERRGIASIAVDLPLHGAREHGAEGRPLLMVNGRFDRTILPSQATALFEAARESKELRWYQGGHWPPARAIREAADWLASQLGEASAQARPA